MKETVRSTQYGKVEGLLDEDEKNLAWLGVPFARPPIGKLRWQRPQAPEPWTGVKSVKECRDPCAQVGGFFGVPDQGKDFSTLAETFWKLVGSEDCLYLNIYSPVSAEQKLPVLVFVHGGINRVGATYDPQYIGNNLARNGNMVVVNIAYRLGHFGWFNHPALKTGDPLTDSGNYALLDLIEALKFMKSNIAGFGGDPDNITVMGQSAGSQNVHGLILSPLATGLFHKAIPLSAGTGIYPPVAGEEKANAFINALLIKDGYVVDKASADTYRTAQSNAWIKDYLTSKSTADLINVQVIPTGGKWGTGDFSMSPGTTDSLLADVVYLFADGNVLPKDHVEAIKSGNFNKVPQLVGMTADEGKLFTTPGFKIDRATEFRILTEFDPNNPSHFGLTDFLDPDVFKRVTAAEYNTYACDNANKLIPPPLLTTALFRHHIEASKQLFYGKVPLYAYNFKWAQQSEPWKTLFGAVHVLDLPFIFGNFKKGLFACGFSKMNEPGRLVLSMAMQQSIAAFVRTGDPNHDNLGTKWEQWTPEPGGFKNLVFDADYTDVNICMENY